jgi:hypothetical protein
MIAKENPPVVKVEDPAHDVSGMVSLTLDPKGRLRGLRAVPPQVEAPVAAPPREPDWGTLFAEAGLDIGSFSPAAPAWLSPTPFDARAAWAGRLPGGGDALVQVLAAAYRGRPVYFEIVGPWSRPLQMETRPQSATARLASVLAPALFAGVIVFGVVFARRNVRLGRGDRRGAFRLFVFGFTVALVETYLEVHHVADARGEWRMFFESLGGCLLPGGFVWLLYLAVEPYVRRRWPDLLISWNRLLAGHGRDPLVGRDALAGSLLGFLSVLTLAASQALNWFVSVPGETPLRPNSLALRGPRQLLASLLDVQVGALIFGLLVLALLFLSHLALKKRWLAVVVTGLVLVAIRGGGENPWLEVPVAVLLVALTLAALIRTGVLGLVVFLLVEGLLNGAPLTLDLSRWYAGHGLLLVAAALAVVAWAFHTSLGGRPMFGGAALDD